MRVRLCPFVRSVRNSLTGGHSALKKIPNVFGSLLSAIRTYREVRMLCELSHDNVSGKKVVNSCYKRMVCGGGVCLNPHLVGTVRMSSIPTTR